MSPKRFLALLLPLALILPLAVLILPANLDSGYLDIVQIILLLGGGALSFTVALSYRKELKTVFLFLALYLGIFGLAVIFLPLLEKPLGALFTDFVLGWQLINYVMLVIACVYILKVVSVKKLNAFGWVLSGAALIISFFTALYPLLNGFDGKVTFDFAVGMAIRLVDAALVTALVPIIWLYIQHLKTNRQQSLTFTVIVSGIVFSTICDYLYQTILTVFPRLTGSGAAIIDLIPNMIYAYGFSVIAIGLYAHWKQDEWGYKMLEKALAI